MQRLLCDWFAWDPLNRILTKKYLQKDKYKDKDTHTQTKTKTKTHIHRQRQIQSASNVCYIFQKQGVQGS